MATIDDVNVQENDVGFYVNLPHGGSVKSYVAVKLYLSPKSNDEEVVRLLLDDDGAIHEQHYRKDDKIKMWVKDPKFFKGSAGLPDMFEMDTLEAKVFDALQKAYSQRKDSPPA